MKLLYVVVGLLLFVGCAHKSCDVHQGTTTDKQDFQPRKLKMDLDGKWIGTGVSYSAYRDGESPIEGSLTSKENILEDMKIIIQHWNLIRVYGSDQQTQNILEVIRDNELPVRVMLGAWVSKHNSIKEDEQQIEWAIKLANMFPQIVICVNVGNEIFVEWSGHRVDDRDRIIGYIREIRSKISQPVTINDDFNFWNKPEAKKVVKEVDFIGLHAYAFWNNQLFEDAQKWTDSIYFDIKQRYPDYEITFSELGWPTNRVYNDTSSWEGKMRGIAGEEQQKEFYEWVQKWATDNAVPVFYFEAFDENWKGGMINGIPKPNAENHWGVFNEDRTPKKALQ